MDLKPKLDLIILDCPDALALGSFYAEVLGWGMEDGADERWCNLIPPGGGLSPDNPDGHATLAFQRIDDWVEPTWPGGAHPQQFHLDLATPDMDASEALKILDRNRRVDLVFTDIGLPGLNGRELAATIQRRYPGVRLLFTSGYAQMPAPTATSSVAEIPLLSKPFTRAQLHQRISEVLKRA